MVQVMLIGLLAIPIIGVTMLILLRRLSLRVVRRIAISITSLPIFIILILIYEISHTQSLDLLMKPLNSLSLLTNLHDKIHVTLVLGIDSISLWLMLFVSIIILLTIFAGVYIKKRQRLFYGLIILVESLLFTLFMAREGLLLISIIAIISIIMFMFIGIWGQEGSYIIARKFVIWQLAACVLLIISSLLLTTLHTNEINNEYQLPLMSDASYMIQDQWLDEQPDQQQIRQAAFILFVLALLCMLPMIGLHHWFIGLFQKSHMVVLMLYNGAISILGWYVLYRIGSIYFFDLLASLQVALLWIFSIQFLFSTILIWKQQHLRGWLAYGAWGQLSLIGILMLTLSEQGLTISLLHLLSYVVSSSLLCFLLAAIIERARTDELKSLRGILKNTPFLGGSLVAAILAWVGIPGLSQFIGTAHAVILTFPTSRWMSVLITLGIICSILVAIGLLYKLQNGKFDTLHEQLKDLRFSEALPIIVLLSLMILLGCYPIVVVDMFQLELHTIYSVWNDIGVAEQWDMGAVAAIWTTNGAHSNIVIVFALLMMLAIGIASRKNNQIRAIIYWQVLFQFCSLVVIIASSYEIGNVINGLEILLYVAVYMVLLIATMLAVRGFYKTQHARTIPEWNGLYYRNPRLALIMLWLIINWISLPFTSPFQLKLTAISVWVEQGNIGLLTAWTLLHLMMMKMWIEWLHAIYVESDLKQATTHSALPSLESNGITTIMSRNTFILLLCCCFMLITLSFIV